MSGIMVVMGPCFGCGTIFEFNPDRVPSISPPRGYLVVGLLGALARIPTYLGPREPICEACVRRANDVRVPTGLPAIEILPGAYDSEEGW